SERATSARVPDPTRQQAKPLLAPTLYSLNRLSMDSTEQCSVPTGGPPPASGDSIRAGFAPVEPAITQPGSNADYRETLASSSRPRASPLTATSRPSTGVMDAAVLPECR